MKKNLKLIIFVMLTTLLSAVQLYSVDFTKDELDYLATKKEIKLCVDPNWLPLEAIQNNKHIGIAADIFAQFEHKLDTPIKLITTKDWSESVEYAKKRKCDIYSLASKTQERTQYMDFTIPYITTPLVLVTLPDKLFIDSIETIKNKKLGMVKGYAIIQELKTQYPNIDIVEVHNIDEGLDKVSSGEIYGYIDNLMVAAIHIQSQYNNLKISGRFHQSVDLSIATRNDEIHLHTIFQKLIDTVAVETKRSICNKWVPISMENKNDYRWLWGILIVVLIILFFIVNRQMKLRKRNFQLEDASSQLQMIINTTVEAIIVSENKKCIFMNKSAKELFLIKEENEFLGKSLIEFVDDDYKKMVQKNLKKESVELYEIYIQRVDGIKIPVLTKGTNIIHQGKNIRVSSIIDISDMKQKEQQLLQQTKLASMGEMIGNIAHQWRQPLSVISTSATGMKLQKEFDILKDEDLYNHCDKINENAQYLSQTIDDFTNFIKGESKPVQFNLKNDTDSFIKLVDSSIKLYNINVILDLQEDIKIKGYPSELIQCFINVFNNARDALLENNEEDNRYIFIEQRSNNDEVVITFTDNAGGIPNDIINSIFEPYFTTKHKSQGTGLGLHMSYNLVVNGMKGIIVVKNDSYEFNGKAHRGAKFTITIPLNHKT